MKIFQPKCSMEEQKSNRFLLGILSAIMGAFIGAIPFILVYVFLNYIVAMLTALIAAASFYAYRLTKAKIDKKLPVIVALSSVLSITVAIFIIIPLVLMAREGIDVSFKNLGIVYKFDEFKTAIIGDYIKSLIFAIIGVGVIVATLREQIKQGKSAEEIKLTGTPQQLYSEEDLQVVRGVFESNNAIVKENGLSKEYVIQELNTYMPETKAMQLFNILKAQGYIRKKSGKYYFNQKMNSKKNMRVAIIIAIVMTICFVAIIVGVVVSTSDKNKNDSKSKSSSSSRTVDYDDDDDDEEIESEDVYTIKEAKMKFIPTDDLVMVSGKNIKKYYGQEAYETYDMIAVNDENDVFIGCSIYDDRDYEDYTEKEILEEMFDESDYDEIKTVTVNGFKFDVAVMSYSNNGKDFNEYFYVYKADDAFVFIEYIYPKGEKNNFKKMIEKN